MEYLLTMLGRAGSFVNVMGYDWEGAEGGRIKYIGYCWIRAPAKEGCINQLSLWTSKNCCRASKCVAKGLTLGPSPRVKN